MKADPFHIRKQDQAGSDEVLRKHIWIDSFVFETTEVDTRFLKEIDGVRGVHVVAVFGV